MSDKIAQVINIGLRDLDPTRVLKFCDKLYISSLIVLYAEDQDAIRSDQMTFINQIINQ